MFFLCRPACIRYPAKRPSSASCGPLACALIPAFPAPGTEQWGSLAGILLLLLALLTTVWFYRRLANQIRHSRQELKELLEAAPFAVAVSRRSSGKLLFANRRAISLLALSPDYSAQYIPYANGGAEREALLARLHRDGAIIDREVELVAFDGRRFPALGSITPITFAGQPALIGAFQDVSNLKATELKVRSSEMRLRALFETVPDGIVVLDREGRIRQASESCGPLVGAADLTAYLGRSILECIVEDDRTVAQEMLRRVVAGETREPVAYRIARADGATVWVEPRGVPIDDPVTGQPLIILVLRNITQRREAQQQLAERAAKLQEALNRIAHLQNEIVRVCAWTKQVDVDGHWIPIDHYLAKYLGLKVSHGISEKGLEMLGAPPEEPPPPPPAAAG